MFDHLSSTSFSQNRLNPTWFIIRISSSLPWIDASTHLCKVYDTVQIRDQWSTSVLHFTVSHWSPLPIWRMPFFNLPFERSGFIRQQAHKVFDGYKFAPQLTYGLHCFSCSGLEKNWDFYMLDHRLIWHPVPHPWGLLTPLISLNIISTGALRSRLDGPSWKNSSPLSESLCEMLARLWMTMSIPWLMKDKEPLPKVRRRVT